MTTQDPITFEPLPMRREVRVPVNANQYRVITATGEALEVEATTAYEAFNLSGVSGAARIERLVNVQPVVLPEGVFVREKIQQKEALDTEDVHEEALMQLMRRRTPVISAQEMNRLMTILRSAALPPLPAEEGVEVVAQPDVDADAGFDEIAPSTVPAKPVAAARPVPTPEPSVEVAAEEPAADEPPAKELSQDDIDKLLNG